MGEKISISIIFKYIIRRIAYLLPPCKIKNIIYSYTGINIGKNVFIGDGVRFIDGFNKNQIRLKDYSVLSPGCILISHASTGNPNYDNDYNLVKSGKITIGEFSWIGSGAIIMPNVTIGSKSILGANSMLNKNIDQNEIWGGIPAKFIKKNIKY